MQLSNPEDLTTLLNKNVLAASNYRNSKIFTVLVMLNLLSIIVNNIFAVLLSVELKLHRQGTSLDDLNGKRLRCTFIWLIFTCRHLCQYSLNYIFHLIVLKQGWNIVVNMISNHL